MSSFLKPGLVAAVAAAFMTGLFPLTQAQVNNSQAANWAGTWEGKRDGVPSVVLRITKTAAAFQGEADFYIVKKADGREPEAGDKMTVPMVEPHVTGNSFVFQVMRPSDKTLLNFSLEPSGDHAAKLVRTGGDEKSIEVDMMKTD
jgi:hypothetical protein